MLITISLCVGAGGGDSGEGVTRKGHSGPERPPGEPASVAVALCTGRFVVSICGLCADSVSRQRPWAHRRGPRQAGGLLAGPGSRSVTPEST